MTLNLNQVRSAIQKYLDDDGTRWTVGSGILQMDAEIDRAIYFSVQQAMRFYIKNGGDGLLIQKRFTTDANGQVSLGQTGPSEPGFISNVCISDSGSTRNWAICTATRADEVEYPDNAIRDIRVNYVSKPYFDSATGDLVVFGDTVTGTPMDLPELSILTILYATRTLLPKDNEQNMSLSDAIFQAESSVGATISTPLAVEFPRYGMSQQVMNQYRWAFIPYDAHTDKRNVIQIHRPLYSFYDKVI